MRSLPVQFLVFLLTVGVEIFAVSILTKPAISPSHNTLNESLKPPTQAFEPSIVAAPEAVESLPKSTEETRLEQFADEKRIGRPGKNKIEIKCYSQGNERFAEIRFYTKSEYGAWIEIQSFKFDKDGVTDCDPFIEDFNKDGLKDFSYQSNVAARGANEVRKLFIYDRTRDALVYIQNSENYPNLAYNKTLNCVDSFIVTGTTETVFLHIDGDKLREFASVDNGLLREVMVTDKTGKSQIIRRQKYNIDDFDEAYRRFSNYDPLR